MTEQYQVVARVVSQKGNCVTEHKVGDEFLVADKTPTGMCSWAFYAIFPFVTVLQFGGSFPWEKDRDKAQSPAPTRQIQ